jgi:hypothetical protein
VSAPFDPAVCLVCGAPADDQFEAALVDPGTGERRPFGLCAVHGEAVAREMAPTAEEVRVEYGDGTVETYTRRGPT